MYLDEDEDDICSSNPKPRAKEPRPDMQFDKEVRFPGISRVIGLISLQMACSEKICSLSADYVPVSVAGAQSQKPKGPVPAHIRFGNGLKAALKSMHPNWTNGDLSRAASRLWREAPDEVRAPFQIKFQEEKALYNKQLQVWKMNCHNRSISIVSFDTTDHSLSSQDHPGGQCDILEPLSCPEEDDMRFLGYWEQNIHLLSHLLE